LSYFGSKNVLVVTTAKVAVKITRNYGIEEENRMHVAKV